MGFVRVVALLVVGVGCGTEPVDPPDAPPSEVEAEVLALEGDPKAGESLFDTHCYGCHSEFGTYASGELCGIYLVDVNLAEQGVDDIVRQVLEGNDCMPAFGEGVGGAVELSPIEVADVAAYVNAAW